MKTSGLVLGLLAAIIWSGDQLQAQEIAGIWQGIFPGSVNERVVLTISKEDTGVLSSQFYSVDHAQMYPVDATTYEAGVLKCSIHQEGWSYEGKLSPDGKAIIGTWKWNASGNGITLNFERATNETNWAIDTTPHKVSFVTAEPGVKLEVLDWGGMGRPLVLLAGLGDNAHVFDKFAQKLTDRYHVYGITRRGFGASDSPPPVWENYSADRLGDDVISVLDQLKLERPVLAGHSIAGEELSFVGTRYPERVAGLIYLDAGYEFAMYVHGPISYVIDWNDMRKKVNAIASAPTPQEQKALIQEMLQTELPRYEQELKDRQKVLRDLPDELQPSKEKINSSSFKISQAIFNGEERFTEIKCPVLTLFREPLPSASKPGSDATGLKRQAVRDAEGMKITESQAKAFEALGPNVRVVMLPGANHYIFRSNETDVLREMNAFIATLP